MSIRKTRDVARRHEVLAWRRVRSTQPVLNTFCSAVDVAIVSFNAAKLIFPRLRQVPAALRSRRTRIRVAIARSTRYQMRHNCDNK